MRELLRDHDTRRLLSSQWVAQIGDGLVQASFVNELILEPESTIGRILAVSALTLLPYSMLAPFMGVFVDRWRRRNVLVGANVARAAILTVLALIIHVTENDLPLYLGLLSLLGFGRLFLTTKGAVLPFVLHERHLLQGNSLSGGVGMIAALAGGVIGIGATGILDTANSLFVGVALYTVSALLARSIYHPMGHDLKPTAEIGHAVAGVMSDLLSGLEAIYHRAAARLPLVGVFVVRVAAMVSAITAILIIKESFPDAGDRFGRLSSSALALGAAGLGAFVGALVAPILGRRYVEPTLMMFGFVLAGIGIMALGGIESIPAVLGLTFMGGLGGFIAKVAVDAQVQRALPDDFRGRGFAVYDILYNLATVVAATVLLMGQNTSLRSLSAGIGLVILLFAVALGSAMRKAGLFDQPREGTPAPEMPATH